MEVGACGGGHAPNVKKKATGKGNVRSVSSLEKLSGQERKEARWARACGGRKEGYQGEKRESQGRERGPEEGFC
jgi:hypothetical protein